MASTQRASVPKRCPKAVALACKAVRESKVPLGVPVEPEVEQTIAISLDSIGKSGSSARITDLIVAAMFSGSVGIGAMAGPEPSSARRRADWIWMSPPAPGEISTEASVRLPTGLLNVSDVVIETSLEREAPKDFKV